jgi:hypothetical protein
VLLTIKKSAIIETGDRINIHGEYEVRFWAKELGVRPSPPNTQRVNDRPSFRHRLSRSGRNIVRSELPCRTLLTRRGTSQGSAPVTSEIIKGFHKVLVPPRGLFASGKFDQYKRDIPYATLAQALQGLIRPLLGKSEAELRNWRDTLREALGPNGPLIVDLVPELKLIIGEQPPVPDLPPQNAQGRFQLVFRRFIGVFARREHPLALFLDDLQWLDAATLDLLEDLLAMPEAVLQLCR